MQRGRECLHAGSYTNLSRPNGEREPRTHISRMHRRRARRTLGPVADPDRTHFGRLLRKYREREGFTQESLAKALAVSESAVAMVETGKRAVTQDFLDRVVPLLALTEDEHEGFVAAAGEVRRLRAAGSADLARLAVAEDDIRALRETVGDLRQAVADLRETVVQLVEQRRGAGRTRK